MVDFINQTDIDSILKGTSVQAPAREMPDAETYNFLRPHRISKDRRSTLDVIYQRFAVALQALLSSRLRQVTDVSVASVEQATFAEFIMSLSTPCSAFVFELGDASGIQGVLDIGTDLAYHLIDRMFGGPGHTREIGRPLTPLERLVLKGVVDHALGFFGEAWHDHLPFKPAQIGFEALPDQLSVASREDNVLVANVDVKAGGFSGLLTVCVPLLALEAFLQEKRTTTGRARVSDADRSRARTQIEATIRNAQVPVTAQFPLFTLRAREVAALAPGQVIHTGFSLDVPVEVHVCGRRRFLGTPGQLRRAKGVRISHVIPAAQSDSKARARARVV